MYIAPKYGPATPTPTPTPKPDSSAAFTPPYVTATDSIYGSLTFAVEFAQDPVTKVMSGNGRGVRTFAMPGFGDVTVVFVFSVSNQDKS